MVKKEVLNRILTDCPRCKARKDFLNAKTIIERKDAQLLYIKCTSCQGSVIAVVFTTGPLISSVGLITDMSEADVMRFTQADALNEEDLILVHEALQQEDICKQLLSQQRQI